MSLGPLLVIWRQFTATKEKHLQILGIEKVSTITSVMNYYRFDDAQCGVFTWTAVESASPTSPGGNYSASSSWDKELQSKTGNTRG